VNRFRVFAGAALVVAHVVQVGAPLPHVAVQIVEAEGVGELVGADLAGAPQVDALSGSLIG
jgi:hypothetical protein